MTQRSHRIQIQPIPLEGQDNYRSGAAQGCQRIIDGLESVEDYSREFSRSLPKFDILPPLPLQETQQLAQIRTCAKDLFSEDKRCVFVGGDHGISTPLIEAAVQQWPDLVVFHFDAHLDRRSTHQGERHSHATVFERLENRPDPVEVYSFGIRAHGLMEHLPYPERIFFGSHIVTPLVNTLRKIGKRPLYLSLDIDVLDPSVFPAVSNPEPQGVSWPQMTAALQWLAGHLVAADLMEYVPANPNSSSDDCLAGALLKLLLIALAG